MDKKNSEMTAKQVDELKILRSALQFIHEIAYDDLRTANNRASTWSIEAIAAKALGLADKERDLGFTADDKLNELIQYVGAKCEAEVAEHWLNSFKLSRGKEKED
jgi:hypothetical protein